MSSVKTQKYRLRRTKIFNHFQEILKNKSSPQNYSRQRTNFQVLQAIFIIFSFFTTPDIKTKAYV